jgi:hypothetical protein
LKGWVGLFLVMPGVTALLTVLASPFSKVPRDE